jgi:hypothetical protein
MKAPMNRFIPAIVTVSLLMLIISISACSSKEFSPDVSLSLDRKSINVDDNTISTDWIKATITRTDNTINETVFQILFPTNISVAYATDIDGKRIESIQTKPLKGKGAQDIIQFKIYATKQEFDTAQTHIDVQLWWDNKNIDTKTITVEVE